MADFDFSTLITDRGQSDLATLRSVLSTPMEEWTAEQLAAFNQAARKGSYNYTDLNRVTAAMDAIHERLTALGYETGYSSVVVHQPQPQQPTLPDGYTELEYIQSNGTQYINTGVNPDQDTRVVADLQPIAVSICGIFGARIAKETACFMLWQVDQTTIEDNYGSDATRVSVPSTTTRVLVDKNKNQLSYGNTIFTAAEETFSCNYPMALFGVNSGGVIDNRRVSMRLYSCKIYDNGALVRDYLPCINPSSEIGLYDLVGKKFYENAGTGVFTAGYQPGKLPAGYTQLEYIQSSGTQYIDTGFKQNQNSRIVMSAQVTQQPSTHAWLFEGRISNRSGGKSVFLLDGAVWNADYNGSARREAFPDIGIFDALSIDFDKNSLQINEDSFTWTISTFQSTANLSLLACNTAGAISGYISAKLYNCQIYDNGTMIRDFVPCQDPTGNVGLYDLVGAQFYGNAGSGTFTAGPEVPQPEPEPLDPYTWYESDVPTESTMAGYLANVSALREVLTLPENTAEVPADMAGLTLAEANAIEEILLVIEDYLTALASVFRRCDAAICGGPGFYFKN